MITPDKTTEVAADSLHKASLYSDEQNWGRAFAHYLVVFELKPELKDELLYKFEDVLWNLGKDYENKNELSNLGAAYTTAIRYFPYSSKILFDFGSYLVKMKQPSAALEYLEAAKLCNDSSTLLVEKNIQTAKLDILPRWHIRMMNDTVRNRAYLTALQSTLNSDSKVLDIGSGCGLLSFYASRCPHSSITAIESSEKLALIATEALRVINNVTVINKHSSTLSKDDVGLHNILVTEIFDAGLFGEHALETLIHAWENLLEPSAIVIPQSANLFVTGISSRSLFAKNKVVCNKFNLGGICIRQLKNEPYETENLALIPIDYITDTQLVVNVNFNDLFQLKRLYNDRDCIPLCTLTCTTSGTIHAFAIWFNLNLTNKITISTCPWQDSVKCWEQAVIYLDHPVALVKGNKIQLLISCTNNKLQITVQEPFCSKCFEVSPEIVSFLNERQIIEIAENLELSSDYSRYCNVLDLNPVPVFALARAKQGRPGHYTCVAHSKQDYNFLSFLWGINVFPSTDNSNITFSILEKEEALAHPTNSLDIIFINPICKNGILDEETFDYLPHIINAMKINGCILPSVVSLEMELIDSDYLDFCNQVRQENLLGYNVADSINEYAISEEWQVHPLYYPRKTITTLTTTHNLMMNGVTSEQQKYRVKIPLKGRANGVICWYSIQFSKNLNFTTYKSAHYNGVCHVFKTPLSVEVGDSVTLVIEQEKSFISISCADQEGS